MWDDDRHQRDVMLWLVSVISLVVTFLLALFFVEQR